MLGHDNSYTKFIMYILYNIRIWVIKINNFETFILMEKIIRVTDMCVKNLVNSIAHSKIWSENMLSSLLNLSINNNNNVLPRKKRNNLTKWKQIWNKKMDRTKQRKH